VGKAVGCYKEVVRITEDYFGPAASRYINRIIVNHFNKSPDHLTATDLPELVKWATLTMAMVTEDAQVVREFTERLSKLDGAKAA
jgi:hypothetical protein